MLIFIDESGIHKQIDHSTFVLSYVEAKNYDVLEQQVIEIEKSLKINYFHWAETAWKVKEIFLNKVLKLDFKVKVAILKNPVKPAEELERALSYMIIEKNIKNIYIDGKKPKWYENRIKKILRTKGITVKKLKTVKDNQYAGIRLADMIAGLSRSYFDKRNLEKISKYYKRLEKKIIVVIK